MTESNAVVAPWEGISTDVGGQRFHSPDEMLTALGLNYTVEARPLVNERTGKLVPRNVREVVCVETGATLGIVQKKYHTVQNREAFGWLPQLAGEQGLEIMRGGQLDDGAVAWVLAKLGEHTFQTRRLPNGELDKVAQFLLFFTSHNGETSCRIAALLHDFWCSNALASQWRSAKERWTVNHTRSAQGRLQEAHRRVVSAKVCMDDTVSDMESLEAEAFSTKKMRDYAEALLTDVQGAIDESKDSVERAKAARERSVSTMVDLFKGEGKSCLGRSKLDAYQAVTDFIDHHRRRAKHAGDVVRAQSAVFNDTVFGSTTQRFRRQALVRLRGGGTVRQ